MNNPIRKLSFSVVAEMWKCFLIFPLPYFYSLNSIGLFAVLLEAKAGIVFIFNSPFATPSPPAAIHFVLYKFLSYTNKS